MPERRKNRNLSAFDVQLEQRRLTISLYEENWKQKKSTRGVRRDAEHYFERRFLRADCTRLRFFVASSMWGDRGHERRQKLDNRQQKSDREEDDGGGAHFLA